MTRIVSLIFALTILWLPCVGSAEAGVASSEIEGPISADIIRVIDGDTVLVSAKPWPQQSVEVYVRLRGVDAPEKTAKCAATRKAGMAAERAFSQLMAGQSRLQLRRITGDKYFGRVVADILLADGRNAADVLLSGGYVAVYDGGSKPRSCATFW